MKKIFLVVLSLGLLGMSTSAFAYGDEDGPPPICKKKPHLPNCHTFASF